MTMLFLAADGLFAKEQETLKVLADLASTNLTFGIKINLDYILRRGCSTAVKAIQGFGRLIFCDIKMFNGSRTMVNVAKEIVDQGAEFLNVYAQADALIPPVIEVTRGTNTKVLGVTLLTHFDREYCEHHFKQSWESAIQHLAFTAIGQECDGIILPGTALDLVEDMEVIKVVPGVRPSWYKDTRHEEAIEPSVAMLKGADIVVCGGPIMMAGNPKLALKDILAELS